MKSASIYCLPTFSFSRKSRIHEAITIINLPCGVRIQYVFSPEGSRRHFPGGEVSSLLLESLQRIESRENCCFGMIIYLGK